MNTTNVDIKKRGRKPSGLVKVAYFRRVESGLIPSLDMVVYGPEASVKQPAAETDGYKIQIKALLVDVDRLTKELADLKVRYDGAVQATPDQLSTYWKRKFMETQKTTNEFDQG